MYQDNSWRFVGSWVIDESGRTSRLISRSRLAQVASRASLCFCVILVAEKLKWTCLQNLSSNATILLSEYTGLQPFQNGWLSNVEGQRNVINVQSSTILGLIFFCLGKQEGGGGYMARHGMIILVVKCVIVEVANTGNIAVGGDDGPVQIRRFGATIERIVNM